MTRDDIERILSTWVQRLNLGHWDIRIRWELEPEGAEDEEEKAEAQIKISTSYDQASIRINKERMKDWDERLANVVIVHELLHVFERGTRQATIALGSVLTAKSYELHWARYEHEAEGWVDRLALVLVELGGLATP